MEWEGLVVFERLRESFLDLSDAQILGTATLIPIPEIHRMAGCQQALRPLSEQTRSFP
jgi:hypothetical protein